MRSANIYYQGSLAGLLNEVDDVYEFIYSPEYLKSANHKAVSQTLPLTHHKYKSNVLFPGFDGLIPEKSLPEIQHLISSSFLPPEMQARFLEIITTNLKKLSL